MRDIEELRLAGDVTGLLNMFETAKKPRDRQIVVKALQSLEGEVRPAAFEMLGEEASQRTAAAVLVELGEDDVERIQALLRADDPVQRRGALLTLYFYARYRGVPAAYESLRSVSQSSSELAKSALSMLEKAEATAEARNKEIDRQLAEIARAQEHEDKYARIMVLRIYASKRGDQFQALQQIVNMRFAGLRRLIELAPEVGDPAVVALLALALHQIDADVVPPVAEALRHGDTGTKTMMLRTLLCLRRAGIAGAAQALEESRVKPTETADRRAAELYKKWVREH